MAPMEATVLRNGQQSSILAEEVEEGDRVVIQSGGKVPVDGNIVAGRALINEAAITGESVPVDKEQGEQVCSGTILDNGYLVSTQKFLEKFAALYTPGILVRMSPWKPRMWC